MINPQLLTKENGFEDGVVVEIEWDTYPITGNDKEIAYWEDAKLWSTDHMVAIRPLTGPMGIWNHAYDDATHLSIDGAGCFQFCTLHKGQNPEGYIPRPFWATRGGE